VRRILLIFGLFAALVPMAGSAQAASAPNTTGNLLVLLKTSRAHADAATTAVHALLADVGGRLAGKSVLQIGLITVRPPLGLAPDVFASLIRALPGVASVQIERRYVPRFTPNDPALGASDPNTGVLQWTLAREDFYNAWNIFKGNGALVGVIDTGIDASHPDLRNKIAAAVNQQDPSVATGTARTDEGGHGTHVSSLACADTNNGFGMAGAGYNCQIVMEKTDFSDSSIAASIVDATNRGVQSINMSFGPSSPGASPAPASEVRALNYAAAHKVVLVAAAADSAGSEQGDPANVLQPAGSAPNMNAGIGLDVTAADYSGGRASFAGFGSEISVAAFGALIPNLSPLDLTTPRGILGAFPANPTDLDSCGCRAPFQGSSYAFLQGTSMAAPQVAALGAMMRALNPYASLQDILRAIKQTAQRPPGTGWRADVGWGIIDAGGALNAIRGLDRLPPVSQLFAPIVSHHRTFILHWTGHDQQRAGLIASGIAYYDVYLRLSKGRSRLLARTSRHGLKFRGRSGTKYSFFVIAVDRAGNRQTPVAAAATRVARGAH
jgi:subtilisin family serine protease